MNHTQGQRLAFNRVELLVLIFAVIIAIGLLMPAVQRVSDEGMPRAQSQNNLKVLGIAIHNWASSNNGKLWVSGSAPEGGKGSFFIQILPYMDGDNFYNHIGKPGFEYPRFQAYYAPFDSLSDPDRPLLSYGLNGYIVNQGTTEAGAFQPVEQGGVKGGVAFLPGTFNERGTANIVAIAERTANRSRTYHGQDIYFSPPHISTLPATTRDFNAADATAFTSVGTQVLMMDGAVRVVALKRSGKVSGDNSVFDIACSLNNPRKLPEGW